MPPDARAAAPGRTGHHPNPFDFVTIPAAPHLLPRDEFDNLGPLYSGFFEVQLTALTPVHVVGAVARGRRESQSEFHRQDGQACIPASEIRGCLRAFVEAATAGWVSQTREEYEKKRGERHLGWRAFEPYHAPPSRNVYPAAAPAIDPAFRPSQSADRRLDVASYMFGMMVEPLPGENKEHARLAAKSKVWVEDAFIPDNQVVTGQHWLPDLEGDAFMGGGKPNRSNWWYFEPAEVFLRTVNGRDYAEFAGGKYRGRKFYFHQDPGPCLAVYDPDSPDCDWAYPLGFHRVWIEAATAGAVSAPFRIYFDRLPRPLVFLLLGALQPGANMRHKLGYGKAFGYGSVAFTVQAAHWRPEARGASIPQEVRPWPRIPEFLWNRQAVQGSLPALEPLIDWNALRELARILNWPDHAGLVFTYPPYQTPNRDRWQYEFGHTVRFSDFRAAMGVAAPRASVGPRVAMTPALARALAEALFEVKRPIHFRLYQERAEGWARIQARVP